MNGSYGNRDLTLDEIAIKEGFTSPFIVDEKVPLSKWFGSVLDVKLKDLSDGDIARLIRQKFHLTYIIPEALYRLYQNPLAGDLYDAEILISMNEVKDQFWKDHNNLTSDVRDYLININEEDSKIKNIKIITEEEPEEILGKIQQFEKKLTSILLTI
ncbi:contact-dependent growth inhibition system immunity protein [Brevibacillus sp. SYSU BS000544]|uniref:contact-dependent growth inhibition system immunity protein n=1 Tax=Brevibacillus sp. SYSU BS000544 TaxID=3416443 RepID=UPI003CE5565C